MSFVNRPFEEGWDAAHCGLSLFFNPYRAGTIEATIWRCGWEDRQLEYQPPPYTAADKLAELNATRPLTARGDNQEGYE